MQAGAATATWDGTTDWLKNIDIAWAKGTKTLAADEYEVTVKQTKDIDGVVIATPKEVEEAIEPGEYVVYAKAPEYNVDTDQTVLTLTVNKIAPNYVRVANGILVGSASAGWTIEYTGSDIDLGLQYGIESDGGSAPSAKDKWKALGDLVTITITDEDGEEVEAINATGKYAITIEANENAADAKHYDLTSIVTAVGATEYDYSAKTAQKNTLGWASTDYATVTVKTPAATSWRIAGSALTVTDDGRGYIEYTGEEIVIPFEYTTATGTLNTETKWVAFPEGSATFEYTLDGQKVDTVKDPGIYTIKISKGDESVNVGSLNATGSYYYGDNSANGGTDISGGDNGAGTKATIRVEVVQAAKPEIKVNDESMGSYTLTDGTLLITPNEGYEIAEVVKNNISQGATSKLSGLAGGDVVEITFQATASDNPADDPARDPETYTDLGQVPNEDMLNAVEHAIESGWMGGVKNGATTRAFQPTKSMTRQEVADLMYKMAGAPEVEAWTNSFADVSMVSSYADAIEWCYEMQIVTGKSATTFDPTGNVTRQQFVTMLARYAQYMDGVDTKGAAASIAGYTDAATVQSYAVTTLAWAVEAGIYGQNTSKLNPTNNVTKAQGATMAYRYKAE